MTVGRAYQEPYQSLELGTVCRPDREKRFGYLRAAERSHAYIFVVGRPLSQRSASQLKVGCPVGEPFAETRYRRPGLRLS